MNLCGIEFGHCHCGCGQKTKIDEQTQKKAGLGEGETAAGMGPDLRLAGACMTFENLSKETL